MHIQTQGSPFILAIVAEKLAKAQLKKEG